MKKKITNLQNLQIFAHKLAGILEPNTVILFSGELGAGKTTFIKEICQSLGVHKDNITSPTFTLIQQYQAKLPIFHLDLYRLNSSTEIFNLDIIHYLENNNALVLIEWGEKLLFMKDLKYLMLEFHIISENERKIVITYHGEKYQKLANKLIN